MGFRSPLARVLASGLALVLTPLALGAEARAQPNIVVVVADDVGVDLIGSYEEFEADTPAPPEHALTPNIDALASQGVLFRNAWSAPLCAATRATILTGRYGFRTGVGAFLPVLPDDELIVPEVLSAQTAFGHAAIGKWHVTRYDATADPPQTPVLAGFGEFHGARANLHPGQGDHYFSWLKTDEVVAGSPVLTAAYSVYATSDNVDDAIAWIDGRQGPWFLWLAFNAVHAPYQAPPEDLHQQQDVKDDFDPGDIVPADADPDNDAEEIRPVRNAMLEAMDTEIGRLLWGDGVDWPGVNLGTTTVIFVGDNGTQVPIPNALNAGAKGDVLEGGINVPLIITGAGVAAVGETAALAHTADLFATILALAGVDPASVSCDAKGPIDSESLLPVLGDLQASVRATVYTDGMFIGSDAQDPENHAIAIRDAQYKLIIRDASRVGPKAREFYDLIADPEEAQNLVGFSPEQAALETEITALTGSEGTCPPPPRRCGLGFEFALVLAPLAWLWRRRRGAALT